MIPLYGKEKQVRFLPRGSIYAHLPQLAEGVDLKSIDVSGRIRGWVPNLLSLGVTVILINILTN